jgi:hypothetical protein
MAAVMRHLEHAFVRVQSANLQLLVDNLLMDWPKISI